MPLPTLDAETQRLDLKRDPRQKPLWAVICLGLGLGLLAVLYLGAQVPPGQVQKLPGGARIELRGWTFGPDHTFIDGDSAHRLLLQAGDDLTVLGGFRARHQDMGNDLVLWFRSNEYEFPGRELGCAWIDPHGCRISTGSGWASVLPHYSLYAGRKVFWKTGDLERSESRWVEAPPVTPRRGQNPLKYAIFDREQAEPLATFSVPGVPRVSRDTAGSPTPLPIRRTVGDTTFILKSLRHEEAGRYPLSRSALTLGCEGKGPHSRSWRPVRVLSEDGTGNELASTVPDGPPRAPALFETLCRRDPAWKLSVRFARTDPGRVPPDAVWTARGIPVPRPGEEVELSKGYAGVGVAMLLDSLKSPGFDPGGGGKQVQGLDPATLVFTLAAPEGCQLSLLRVTDQQGRVLPQSAGKAGYPSWDYTRQDGMGESSYDLPLVYPTGTRKLNLTFAFHTTRTAEFIVRP